MALIDIWYHNQNYILSNKINYSKYSYSTVELLGWQNSCRDSDAVEIYITTV